MEDIIKKYYQRKMENLSRQIRELESLDEFYNSLLKDQNKYPEDTFGEAMEIASKNSTELKILKEHESILMNKYGSKYGES